MASIKFLLNGREATGEEGKPLISVLGEEGVYVPSICWEPSLRPLGTCDTCIVEVDGELRRACEVTLREGLRVNTQSERVLGKREEAISSLIREHLLYCTLCDNNLDCRLHEAVVRSRVRKQTYTHKGYPRDESNPFYIYDPEQCLLIGKCVEACQNLVVNEVIRIDWNMNPPRVVWSDGVDIDHSACVSCGTCVTACPVNALMEKSILGKGGIFTKLRDKVNLDSLLGGEKDFSLFLALSEVDSAMRERYVRRTKTVCPFCGVGCSYEVWTRGREVLKVEPRSESPANGIATCVKGKFGWDFLNSRERVTHPMVREGDRWVRTDWDSALKLVGEKLREVISKYGPDSVGVIASCTSTNEEAYLVQKLARTVIGTNNVDNCARYCQAPATVGLMRTVGYGADSGSFRDIEEADLVVIIGSNTAEAHPVLAGRIKRGKKLRGQRLAVIDVRRHEMAERADLFLSPRPGTDLVLLKGLSKYILDMGWEDREFLRSRVENLEEYKRSLEGYTIEEVERVTGVKGEEVKRLAEMIHSSGKVVWLWAMGVTQHQDGSDVSTEICNLQLITGNFGREGTGGYPLRGHANVQGACDMGALPNLLPGYLDVTDPRAREKFSRAWGKEVPGNKGTSSTEMVEEVLKGRLKALIVFGEDKVLADADQRKVREALGKLELLVVVDMFMTRTGELAGVFLPTASSLEKEGTFTNTERRIQRLYRAFPPPGEAKTDLEIVQGIANSLGAGWDYRSPREVMEEISRIVPEFAGVTYDRLEGFRSLLWPVSPDGRDTRTLYLDRFWTPSGKARLYPTPDYPGRGEGEVVAQRTVSLDNGRALEQFHWTNVTGKSRGLMYKFPGAYLEVSREIAEEYGIGTGDEVVLESEEGRVTVKAQVSQSLRGEAAFLYIHDSGEAAVNLLTEGLDPVSKTPGYKDTKVRVVEVRKCGGCQSPVPAHSPRNGKRVPVAEVGKEERRRRLGTVFSEKDGGSGGGVEG